MPRIKHIVEVDYKPSFRTEKIVGMFDVPISQKLRKEWDVNIPIEDKPWQIGLIVGASGSGKTTLAKQLFPNKMHSGFTWGETSLLDDFPATCVAQDITLTLSQVGFSSPPSWLLPYAVLSNGQKFRVELARCLLEYPDLIVFDEFTSVVDRQVAQIGAHAFQKAIRKTNKQFVAVTCHYDVEPWLQPDWVYDVSNNEFKWGSVRRPELELKIQRVHHKAWDLFKEHHYLTATINTAAVCFVAFLNDRPVGFDAWVPFVGKLSGNDKGMRDSRTVVLPDFQGLGIGNILVIESCKMFSALGYQCYSRTAHPAEIKRRLDSGMWKLTTQGRTGKSRFKKHNRKTCAYDRLTCGFKYVGPSARLEEAVKLYAR